MDMSQRRQAIKQLRRLLRRLERSHSGNEEACPACSLQQLAVQLVDEIEIEADRVQHPDLRPGAASVILAAEAIIAVIYALGIQEADEQGRALQGLLDYVGDIVLDQLGQDEFASINAADEPESVPSITGSRRGGSLH